MTLPRTIPTRPVNSFAFLTEVDFFEYRKRLPPFVGQDGYEESRDADAGQRVPRVIGFLDELVEAQEILTSSITNSVCAVGAEGVGKSAKVITKACRRHRASPLSIGLACP